MNKAIHSLFPIIMLIAISSLLVMYGYDFADSKLHSGMCLTYRLFGKGGLALFDVLLNGRLVPYTVSIDKVRIRVCITKLGHDVANVTMNIFTTSTVPSINVTIPILVNLRNSSVVETNESFPYLVNINMINRYGFAIVGYGDIRWSIPLNISKHVMKVLRYRYGCREIKGFQSSAFGVKLSVVNGTVVKTFVTASSSSNLGAVVGLNSLILLCPANPHTLRNSEDYKKLVNLVERFGYAPFRNPSTWLLLVPCPYSYMNESFLRILGKVFGGKVYVFKEYTLPSILCIKRVGDVCTCSYVPPLGGVLAYDPMTGVLIGGYGIVVSTSGAIIPEIAMYEKSTKAFVEVVANAIVLVNASFKPLAEAKVTGFSMVQTILLIMVGTIAAAIILVIVYRVRKHA